MKVPCNITDAVSLEASGLQPGDPVHVGVVGPGQSTNDAHFVQRIVNGNSVNGVRLSIHGKEEAFPWGDLIELWPLSPTHALSEPEKAFRRSEFAMKLDGIPANLP